MEKIGEILENGTIVRGETLDGRIYKNYKAFFQKKGICYIPEGTEDNISEAEVYTYNDLLNMCQKDEMLTKRLFYNLTWQHPEICLEQLDGVIECQCGGIYDSEYFEICPKCGKEISFYEKFCGDDKDKLFEYGMSVAKDNNIEQDEEELKLYIEDMLKSEGQKRLYKIDKFVFKTNIFNYICFKDLYCDSKEDNK